MKRFVSFGLVAIFMLSCLSVSVFGQNFTSSEVRENSNRIVDKIINCENGKLPEDFDMEEVLYVLQNDPENGDRILEYFDSIATPASMGNPSPVSYSNSISEGTTRHGTCQLTETGEQIVYEDWLYEESPIQETSGSLGENPLFSFSTLRNPINWSEDVPETYVDTKSTFKLYVTRGGGVEWGTGFRIGKNYVATAGHVIYNNTKGWATAVLCVPAYSPNGPGLHHPLGSASADNKNMAVGAGWKDYASPEDDWGVMALKSTSNLYDHSYVGKANANDTSTLLDRSVRTQGYPHQLDSLFLSWGTVTSAPSTTREVNNECTVFRGMSGGPVLNTVQKIVGINHMATDDNTTGTFLRFDTWLYNKMRTYE